MYFVNFFEEYPIYEPAEGGYYYAGSKNVAVYQFATWRKTRQYFNRCFRQFLADNEITERIDRYGDKTLCTPEGNSVSYHFCGGSGRYNETFIMVHSRYVGGNYGICITRGKPREENGYTPYC